MRDDFAFFEQGDGLDEDRAVWAVYAYTMAVELLKADTEEETAEVVDAITQYHPSSTAATLMALRDMTMLSFNQMEQDGHTRVMQDVLDYQHEIFQRAGQYRESMLRFLLEPINDE